MPRVHLFTCGWLETREIFLRAGGSPVRGVRLPMTCALVERSAGALALVDTGAGAVGPMMRFLLGAKVGAADHADAQVRALGHDPRDVRDVLLTHAHVDHAGGLADFPWARVHVARAEHAALARRVVGYYRAAWRHEVDWAPYDFEADGTRDLFGDGSLVALSAPGHTPGHTMFRLRGAAADVFHLGDAAVTPADYMGVKPRPNLFARAIASDRKTMRATMGRLSELRRAHPDAVFVSSHDPAAVARYPTTL